MRPLIAANWKMHGDMSWVDKPIEFDQLLSASDRSSIDVLICPPSVFIAPMKAMAEASSVLLGGQNCHSQVTGAHTGEISADMLKSAGADYVIVGHSERRAGGEGDTVVNTKAKAALSAGLTPIICVGESLKAREEGEAMTVVEAQIADSCAVLLSGDRSGSDIVIAYEPIWAIGTGKTASVGDIAEMHIHIRGLVGASVRILYGGSVKPANAADILATPHVNGALIGGASLNMSDLAAIARSVT